MRFNKAVLVGIFVMSIMMMFGEVASYSLSVTVTGIDKLKGEISIGLFKDEESFPKGEVFAGAYVKADSSTVQYTFENLEAGDYAIAIYHDKNSNKILDTNFMKIPKEGYAFSNNANGTFGPPKYEKAIFTVNSATKQIIEIKY